MYLGHKLTYLTYLKYLKFIKIKSLIFIAWSLQTKYLRIIKDHNIKELNIWKYYNIKIRLKTKWI